MRYDTESVFQLVAKIQQGDDLQSELALWNRYFSRVAMKIQRKIPPHAGSERDHEDLASTTMRRLFKELKAGKIAPLMERMSLWSCISGIMHDKLHREWERRRAGKRRGKLDLSEQECWLEFLESGEPASEDLAVFNDELQILLDQLTEEQKFVVDSKMAFLSNEEIAHVQGVTARTVRRWLNEIEHVWLKLHLREESCVAC